MCPRLFKLCQSREISPNLVTLVGYDDDETAIINCPREDFSNIKRTSQPRFGPVSKCLFNALTAYLNKQIL